MTEPTGDSQEKIKTSEDVDVDDSYELNKLNQINLEKEHLNIKKKLDGSYFCPYTQNKKFEHFIEDLLELNLPKAQTKVEIVAFTRLIETFYCDKIAQLTDENKAKEKNFKRMKG